MKIELPDPTFIKAQGWVKFPDLTTTTRKPYTKRLRNYTRKYPELDGIPSRTDEYAAAYRAMMKKRKEIA